MQTSPAPTSRPDIRSLNLDELKNQLVAWGEKPFRAQQIFQWLWEKRVGAFAEMTNLGKSLREKLEAAYSLHRLVVVHQQRSGDGSIKYGFQLADGHLIEGVLIPKGDRVTACISSQVGCSLSCKFCATGYMPLARNLTHFEILDQIITLDSFSVQEFKAGLTNIVYMGMGEPLLNYKNMLASVQFATSPQGLGISPRRITVSTAGIAKMIKRLGDDGFRCEFALSLHAGNDLKRSEIMPINETNTLDALAEALIYFYEKTGTRVTLEYILLSGTNDSIQDAEELAAFARKTPTKINIIEYNPIHEADFERASDKRLDAFIRKLEQYRLIVNVRRSRGKDVDGGCGQLAIKTLNTNAVASTV